jgi:hypothetical protein
LQFVYIVFYLPFFSVNSLETFPSTSEMILGTTKVAHDLHTYILKIMISNKDKNVILYKNNFIRTYQFQYRYLYHDCYYYLSNLQVIIKSKYI